MDILLRFFFFFSCIIISWNYLLYQFGKFSFTIGQHRIIRISPFANRLSFDAPPPVQRLRCLANYQALRFSSSISALGNTLVSRMKERSANNSGKYISVHLRFEEVSLYIEALYFVWSAMKILGKHLSSFCIGHGCFLLLYIWWRRWRKKRHGCCKGERLEGKIYKTWSGYSSWSNQVEWEMSLNTVGGITFYTFIAFNF